MDGKKSKPQEDSFENDFLKFDLKLLLITLTRKTNIALFILLPILTAACSIVAVKTLVKNQWTSKCMLFRQPDNSAIRKDIPFLYKPLNINTVIETIRTRQNIREVIEQLKLNDSVEQLYQKTQIQKHKNNDIISIIATDSNRDASAEIANTLAETFLKNYIQLQNSSARKINIYYQKSALEVKQKLTRLKAELQQFLEHHKVISLASETETKFKQLNDVEIKLLESKMMQNALVIKIKDIDTTIKGMKKEIQLSYIVNNTDATLLEEKQKQLANLKQKFTDQNPKVIRIKHEIALLQQTLNNNSKKQKTIPDKIVYGDNELRRTLELEKLKAETDLKSIEKNIQNYTKASSKIKNELGALSKLETKYVEMNRNIQLNQNLYSKIETILAASKIALNANVSDIEILEKAVPPIYPNPNRKKIMVLAGAMAGFVLALFLVLAREVLDFSVKSKFDFDNHLDIKMLAQIPDRDRVDDKLFFAAVHLLFDNLLNNQTGNRVIALGSLHHDAGKSFICNNLIDILNKQNKKVLYIEAVHDAPTDIKASLINESLYHKNVQQPAPTTINDAFHKLYFEYNDHLQTQALDPEVIKNLLNGFSTYDYILWELFPFDGNSRIFQKIAQAADNTLIVSRFRRTNRFQLKKCLKFLKPTMSQDPVGVLNYIAPAYYDKTSF